MPKIRQAIPDYLNEHGELVQAVVARISDMPPGHRVPEHTHDWCQLLYSSRGVLNVGVNQRTLVMPPQRAIWLPPHTKHATWTSTGAEFRSLYIDNTLGERIGMQCRTISVPPLLRELILAVLKMAEPSHPLTLDGANGRLLDVLIDQLTLQPDAPLVLPLPEDHRLTSMVATLQANPGDNRDIEAWADTLGASSRTISRLFQKECGLSFREWRQRLRLLASLNLLEQGQSVTSVAYSMGYDSPSAFIAMFKKQLGATPGEYLPNSLP